METTYEQKKQLEELESKNRKLQQELLIMTARNEELHATNEELLSINESLDSSYQNQIKLFNDLQEEPPSPQLFDEEILNKVFRSVLNMENSGYLIVFHEEKELLYNESFMRLIGYRKGKLVYNDLVPVLKQVLRRVANYSEFVKHFRLSLIADGMNDFEVLKKNSTYCKVQSERIIVDGSTKAIIYRFKRK